MSNKKKILLRALDIYNPMDYTTLVTPKELKAWRHKNDYSQGRLAKILGVIPLTVSRWELGVREIPSFLHLALKWLEKEGGELETKGTIKKTKKERR